MKVFPSNLFCLLSVNASSASDLTFPEAVLKDSFELATISCVSP